MLPVHVVGGGVARNSAGIGIVGVDEVEARAALLTPALELGHPSSAAPSAVTLKWRYVSIPFHERQRRSETRKVCAFMFRLSKPVKSLIVRKIRLL